MTTFKLIDDPRNPMCEVTLDSGEKLCLFIDASGLHIELCGNRPHSLATMPSCYNGGLLVFPIER